MRSLQMPTRESAFDTAVAGVGTRPVAHNPVHPTYRPDIDGLRAVAVLSVVTYHAFPSLLPGGFQKHRGGPEIVLPDQQEPLLDQAGGLPASLAQSFGRSVPLTLPPGGQAASNTAMTTLGSRRMRQQFGWWRGPRHAPCVAATASFAQAPTSRVEPAQAALRAH